LALSATLGIKTSKKELNEVFSVELEQPGEIPRASKKESKRRLRGIKNSLGLDRWLSSLKSFFSSIKE
jgi:hypothetical protein